MKKNIVFVFLLIQTMSSLISCGKEGAQPFVANGSSEVDDNPDRTTPPNSEPDLIPIPTISELRWYPTRWQKSWSNDLLKYLEEETYLPQMNLLEGDLRRLNCLGYNQSAPSERKTFWLVFMAAISSQESAFNPKTRYWEDSLNEWSEGLFQLSISDRKPKGGCSLINRRSILTPRPNIFCALDIMENQVHGFQRRQMPQGTLFPIRPYYWSVLTRPKARMRVIEFFKRHLDELPFC